ncbi:hypothetical protein SUGI_0799240 [Cryptomeria japonica]|nr:hypothetical protein SUGI_0799240 [Cryptomeria japonica]
MRCVLLKSKRKAIRAVKGKFLSGLHVSHNHKRLEGAKGIVELVEVGKKEPTSTEKGEVVYYLRAPNYIKIKKIWALRFLLTAILKRLNGTTIHHKQDMAESPITSDKENTVSTLTFTS